MLSPPQKYQVTDDDATEIVKVLNMLNNGEILADYSGKPTLSIATPEQLREAAKTAVRASHEEAHPSGTNRRKSVDMHMQNSPRGSMDMRAPMMHPMGGAMPLGGGYGGVQPGYGMMPMGGYAASPLAPVPAASNESVIKSLADEVARLQQMVQEKRAREAAAAAGLPH